jgi:hypothetical protein
MFPHRTLKTYVARVRSASPREIAYRINQAIAVRRMAVDVHLRRGMVRIPSLDEVRTERFLMPRFTMKVDATVIRSILGGATFTLGEEASAVERFESRWAGTYFAAIRTTPDSPDIRSVWEPARLQHLTILLVHAHQEPLSPDLPIIKSFVRERLLAWIRKNPFLNGPHYLSPMECGLRIPVFFYALMVLDNLALDERRTILEALYLHAWWVSRNLSLYSSLGNHTICECVGLIFAGAVFRHRNDGKAWLQSGMRLLEQEARRQILDDGGPLEQSLGYHRFVLDLLWLVSDFLERNALGDITALKPRLDRAEVFLDVFRDEQGQVPQIGDSDDGHGIAPGVVPKGEPKAQAQGAVAMVSDAGYTVVRTPVGGLLTFDHGPLGMPPLYNHGHADALSITLSVKGVPFLVDSGTFRYNREPQWRRYFKSTCAHNTVAIDGQDQAEQETGFVWRRPYAVRVIQNRCHNGMFLSIEAEHDGYTRLKDPVRHRRSIIQVDDSCFLVRDRFSGQGVHAYELNWHMHPHAEVSKDGAWWRIENEDRVLYMQLAGREDFSLVRGGMNPVLGWYSPRYGIKEPCPVLTCRMTGEPAGTQFVTIIDTTPLIENARLREALCSMQENV